MTLDTNIISKASPECEGTTVKKRLKWGTALRK